MAGGDPAWVEQVAAVFQEYGVPASVWVPIMLAESGGNPNALNDTTGKKDLPAGTQAEYSVGLFQINLLKWGLTPAQAKAEGSKYTDPVVSAKWAAPNIAAAWNALKGQFQYEPNANWAGEVAVRAGFPGGNVDNPCTSPVCNDAKTRIGNIYRDWQNAVNAAIQSLIAAGKYKPGEVPAGAVGLLYPWQTAGANNPPAPGGGSSSTGGGTGNPTPAEVAAALRDELARKAQEAAAAASGAVGSAATGWSTGATGAVGTGAAGALVEEARAALATSLREWLKTPAAINTWFFLFGLFLVVASIWGILSDASGVALKAVGVDPTARGVAKQAIGNAAKAAVGKG